MHQPRRGVTLTEVLVAIFVCSLGLMALMTLFPLGAMDMAQALKDDRCGVAGANAAAILRSVMRASLVNGGPVGDTSLTAAGTGFQDTLASGAPVYLDPIGVNAFGTAPVGGAIPRFSFLTAGGSSYTNALQWCTLLDDIDFAPDGVAINATGSGEISRQIRYSWAWMVRWLGTPNQVLPRPAGGALMPVYVRALEFAVVVYHNRPVSTSAGFVPAAEYPFAGATFDATANQITFDCGGKKPPVKKGSWVMDGSPGEGRFYRVTGVNQPGGGGTLILSLQTPLRRTSGSGTLVVLDNVAEVFDRLTME